MSDNGKYARKPVVEIEELLEAYVLGRELPYDEILDWFEETAVESPQAMDSASGKYKRSGEYLKDEFRRRLEDERKLAASNRRRA